MMRLAVVMEMVVMMVMLMVMVMIRRDCSAWLLEGRLGTDLCLTVARSLAPLIGINSVMIGCTIVLDTL
eukprot:1535879-Karenia_brevis.AAC.1